MQGFSSEIPVGFFFFFILLLLLLLFWSCMIRRQYPDTGQTARRGGERLSDVVEVTLYLRASIPASHALPSPSAPFSFFFFGNLDNLDIFGGVAPALSLLQDLVLISLVISFFPRFSTACVGSVKRSYGMGTSGLVVY